MTSLAQSDKKLVRQGNKEFQNGNFNEAEINYRKALDKNPQKQSAQFNLGDALYEQENYEKAAEVFANSSVEKISNFEKSNTAYNLGNSFLKGGKLNESIAAYKQALKFNPENEEARYNLEYARQKQAQQEQQNQDQNKDDKQDQDKDKQDQNQDQQEQNKDQQEQNQDQQQQDQQNQDQQQQDQQNQQGNQNEQQAQKISKKDAERMLEALKNNEKKTLEKLKKEKKKNAKVIKSEKDW
ncbi:tetratricopeptide repeat protein [Lentimicrobium sp. L6]|nr:tetratricopeptide repeat protein [Lentimicrobium sp. S6]NPD83260.1 tetratricopeptide repeat protein [Lentimicrobium sp. L6]